MLKPATDIRPYLGVVLVSVIAWLTFTLPDHPDAIGWDVFLRLPLEWPLLMLLLLVLPRRLRKPSALLSGLLLLTILFLKIADIGTKSAFERPFNPYLDAKMLTDG